MTGDRIKSADHAMMWIKDAIIITAGVSSLIAVAIGFLSIPAKVAAQEADIKSLKEFREETGLSLLSLAKDVESMKLQVEKTDKKIENVDKKIDSILAVVRNP